MTGRTVWLASYPKSGNTWIRAILTALGTHPHLFGVNRLGTASQPYRVAISLPVFGLDSRWLDANENDAVRYALLTKADRHPADNDRDRAPLIVRKTHEVFRPGAGGREPFPVVATRAAILVMRDPRDVACSYAAFFDISADEAVEALGRVVEPGPGSPATCQTAQPWGSWSSHARSWLSRDVPFPVHVVRYEDLIADAAAVLGPVFADIGLGCTGAQLEAAVDLTRFERLQQSEVERGFRETAPRTRSFFRRGRSGAWREELTDPQVAAIEADHAEVMSLLGYEPTTAEASRRALAEARGSVRRSRGRSWADVSPHLDLRVREGVVPAVLPGSARPRPGLQVTKGSALLHLPGTGGLLVEDGTHVTVQWELDPNTPDRDASWLIQGWAVALAALQRGNLSLHAATVRIGDEVVAVAGRRGAGKSTTAMGLRHRGHGLLTDDVALIEFREEGVWTTPYGRNVHLLPDAAEALGIDFDALPLLGGGRIKAGFRAEEPSAEPQRIDRIVVISEQPDEGDVRLDPVHGAERIEVLAAHASRGGMAPSILGQQRYFELLARLANAVPVEVLRRPAGQWTLDESLDLIEAGALRPVRSDRDR